MFVAAKPAARMVLLVKYAVYRGSALSIGFSLHRCSVILFAKRLQ